MRLYFVVLAFIAFDVLTGIVKGIYAGDINSTKMREGGFHKLAEVLALSGSALLEYGQLWLSFGIDIPIAKTVATYICIMELISIIENICVINPGLARLFRPYLEKLKGFENDEKK